MHVVFNAPTIKIEVQYLHITASRVTVGCATIAVGAERKWFVARKGHQLFIFLPKPTPLMGHNQRPNLKRFKVPFRRKAVV
jgi:hypothetical protein